MRRKIEGKIKRLETKRDSLDLKMQEIQKEKDITEADIKKLKNALLQIEKIESDTSEILNRK